MCSSFAGSPTVSTCTAHNARLKSMYDTRTSTNAHHSTC